jgi:CheY-like chemotaxis protein
MPVMDGMEATRQIRQLPHGKEVKIIAVTASAFTEQRAEMLANGMDDFVRKPYRANEIYDCLSRQLDLKYIYANATPIAETEATLTPDMLTALPVELRQQLYNAIESLDSEQIEAVIAQVASLNPTLSEQLQRLANNYDYPTILMALEQA